MNGSLRVLPLALLVSAALAYAGTGAATITLASAPAAVACGSSSWVNSVVVSVVPGGEGKVFVGQSTQNLATGAGIAQILFPNSGAHSEQFALADPSGNDTINLCNLYVSGEIPGETALASWKYKTGASTGSELVLVQAQSYLGPVPATAPAGCSGLPGPFVPLTSSGLLQDPSLTDTDPSYYFDKIRVQVIPGQEGKIQLVWCNGAADGYFHTLFPNTGLLYQHSAWSEGWELQDPSGQNGLSMYDGSAQPYQGWGFVPEIATEGLQVALWQLQSNNSVVDPANVYSFSGTNSTPPATLSATASRLRFRVQPGYCGKFYFGNSSMNPSSGSGLYKTLFPNCEGGWSEEFVAIPDSTVNVPVTLGIAQEFAGDAISSESLYVSPYGGSGTASSQSVGGGATVLAGAPTAMGTGFVHRITISVTPGQVGQVYIGTSSMSTDLGGVVAILYPNAVGRWSEQFDLIDPQGDGIDLSALYLMGEVPGEYVQVVTETTGITPATPLSVYLANAISYPGSGSCTGGSYTFAVPLTGCPGSAPISAVRIQVIPGQDPSVYVGTSAMLADSEPDPTLADMAKILYPNIGDYDVHEGFSETFTLACQDGTNCLTSDAFSLWPEYAYYPVLVALWQH